MGKQTYFLGSNSASGFYSAYHHFCPPVNDNFLWVIKGGPGCGKSSFMRRIGEAAEQKGLDVEYVICSGDPDSLDGIYIPEKHLGYVDGTAPHVTEARYPGANGLYLDLGQFYDTKSLRQKASEIQVLNQKYKTCYEKAYRILATLPRLSAPSPIPTACSARFHTAVSCKGVVTVMPAVPQVKVTQNRLHDLLITANGDDVVYLHPLWPDIAVGLYIKAKNTLYQSETIIPECTDVLSVLKDAKSLHDELENIYNPHVDFDGVYELSKQHILNYM